MKKALIFLLFCAMLFAALCVFAQAQTGRAVLAEFYLYDGAIATDGKMDAAYKTHGTRMRADYWEGFGEDKTGIVYGDFWFLFTDNYQKLHVFTEMHDDVIILPSEEKHAWRDGACHTDCAEIWLDPTANAGQYGKDDLRGSSAFHYRCDVSGFLSGTMWGTRVLGNEACKPYFDAKVVTGRPYGYDIEWVIDTAAFAAKAGVTAQKGQQWGFQIQAKDVYDARHRGEYWAKKDKDGNPVSYDYNTDYYMCDFFFYQKGLTTAADPATSYLDMSQLDNIILAGAKKDSPSSSFPGASAPSTSAGSTPAPRTADLFWLIPVLLLCSAGAVFFVLRAQRKNR